MRISGIPYVQGKNAYTDADGRKYGIAIHNTSNDATAAQEASYATRRTDGISAHFYVDNKQVIQSLDTNSRAGHAGSGNGNNNAIAVEITGVNAWTRAQWLANVAWDALGRVLAQVCKQYGIERRRAGVDEMKRTPTVRAFYGHDDMRRAWGGTTHTDPGPNFPWDRLFQAVNAALGTSPPPTPAPQTGPGGDMPTPKDLLDFDDVPNPYGDAAANPKIQVRTALKAAASVDVKVDHVQRRVDDLHAKVDAVNARLDQLAAKQASGGVDPAAIAAQIADNLRGRLEQ